MHALGWVFESIADWVAENIVGELMDLVVKLAVGVFNVDLAVFNWFFPYFSKTVDTLKGIALGLLFVIFLWQIVRAFFGPLTDAESPLVLAIRTVGAACGIIFSTQILGYVLKFAVVPMNQIAATFESGSLLFKDTFDTFTGDISVDTYVGGVFSDLVVNILGIVVMIAIGWNYFKLLLEIIERYIVMCVLYYLSPFAFSMAASKTTVNIFKAFLRMEGSEIFLMVMNGWFLSGFTSVMVSVFGKGDFNILAALPNGEAAVFSKAQGRMLCMLCALAYLKVCQNFDRYLGQLGLNTAQTGGFLAAEIGLAARGLGRAGEKGVKMMKNAANGNGMFSKMFGSSSTNRGDRANSQAFSQKAADGMKKGADKAGRFGALAGEKSKSISDDQKEKFGRLASTGDALMNSNSKQQVPAGMKHGELANAMTNGMLNGVAGNGTKVDSIGNGAFAVSGLNTPNGKVGFAARNADGNMKSNEFMFMGAGEKPMYGHFTSGSNEAINAAKASMTAASNNGNGIIANGGNVFKGNSGGQSFGSALPEFKSLSGMNGAVTNVSKGADGSYSGTYIAPNGSMTGFTMAPTPPGNGVQSQGSLHDNSGRTYGYSAGSGAAGASFAAGVAAGTRDSSMAASSSVNSAVGGKNPENFNAKDAATTIMANSGMDMSDNSVAAASFGTQSGSIKMSDGSQLTYSKDGGEYTATMKDSDGTVVGSATGSDAAAVMQAAANPEGFDAERGTEALPAGVSSVSMGAGASSETGYSTDSVDNRLNNATIGEAGSEVNVAQAGDASFSDGKLTENGMEATMSLNDGAAEMPVAFAANYDSEGNLSGYTATVGEGDDAVSVNANSLEEAEAMAIGAGYAMGVTSGDVQSGDAPENTLSSDSASALVANASGVDADNINSTSVTEAGVNSSVSTDFGECSVQGDSLADTAAGVAAISSGDMAAVQDAANNGAEFYGEGVDMMVGSNAGIAPDSVSDASISSFGVGANVETELGNAAIAADSAEQLGNVVNDMNGSSTSGDILQNVSSGAYGDVAIGGDAADGLISGGAGISASSNAVYDSSISNEGTSTNVTTPNMGDAHIEGSDAGNVANVAGAVYGGDMSAVTSDVVSGSYGDVAVTGQTADMMAASAAGIDSSNVSNAVVSSSGISADIETANGSVHVSGSNAQEFSDAVSVASGNVNSDSVSEVSSGKHGDVAMSGGGVDKAVADSIGMNASDVSNSSVSSQGISADISNKNGDNYGIQATSSGDIKNFAQSVEANGFSAAADSVVSGGAGNVSLSGNAADAYAAKSLGIENGNVSNAVVSNGKVSAEVSGNGTSSVVFSNAEGRTDISGSSGSSVKSIASAVSGESGAASSKAFKDVMDGKGGDTKISGAAADKEYSKSFGGSGADSCYNSYFSNGTAGTTIKNSDGTSTRLTTSKNANGSYTTTAERLNSDGKVTASAEIVSAKSSDVINDVKRNTPAFTTSKNPSHMSNGTPSANYYSKAKYSCTSYDASTGKGTAVVTNGNTGTSDNVTFRNVNGKSVITSVNGNRTSIKCKSNLGNNLGTSAVNNGSVNTASGYKSAGKKSLVDFLKKRK